MGRKKITITRISDERNRQITFSKRKYGLLKKAYELSILCDTEIAIMMITSNSKLYQYASSNINEFLMKYTEIQEPFESKTNADVWQDVTRKEVKGEKDDSDEEVERPPQPTNQSFNVANYEKINEEFDQMFKQNQSQMDTLTVTTTTTAGDSVPTNSTMLTTLPPTMPVAVPVTDDASKEHSQDQQPGKAAGGGNVFNPMPPPQVPPRIQALKNPQLKLHLPGSGRNYIKLGNKGDSSSPRSGGSSSTGSSGGELNSANSQSSVTSAAMASPSSFGKGSKPSLRVVIPASKGGSHGKLGMVQTNTTVNQIQKVATTSQHNDPLATPIMSLATPSLFSNLPSMMSGLGDFPFNSNPTDQQVQSALVAIPINLQQSSASGNVMLQAHNLGQPFLLTPTYEPNAPVFPSPGGTSVQGNSQELLAHYLLQQQQQMQKQQASSNTKTAAKVSDHTSVIEQSSSGYGHSSTEQDISFSSSMEQHSRSTLQSYDPSLNSSTLELPVTKRVRLTS